MATNQPQADFQKQGVRIPRDLHERLHEAAKANGRSYNSELIARLQSSFESSAAGGGAGVLRPDLFEQISELAQQHGLTFDQALERAIYAGTNEAAAQVLVVHAKPGMKLNDWRALFKAGEESLQPDTTIITRTEAADTEVAVEARKAAGGGEGITMEVLPNSPGEVQIRGWEDVAPQVRRQLEEREETDAFDAAMAARGAPRKNKK